MYRGVHKNILDADTSLARALTLSQIHRAEHSSQLRKNICLSQKQKVKEDMGKTSETPILYLLCVTLLFELELMYHSGALMTGL